MIAKIMKKAHNQKGITGLETAIILIAFVVVAAVFAYTVLSAGLFSSEQSEEAVYAGLKETQSTMVLKGNVIAYEGTANYVDEISFVVSNALNGEAIDFTAPTDTTPNDGVADTGSSNVVTISYQDINQRVEDLAWSVVRLGENDGDDVLEPGERFEISITDLEASLGTDITFETEFTLELKPSIGAVMAIEKRIPAGNIMDSVLNLL